MSLILMLTILAIVFASIGYIRLMITERKFIDKDYICFGSYFISLSCYAPILHEQIKDAPFEVQSIFLIFLITIIYLFVKTIFAVFKNISTDKTE